MTARDRTLELLREAATPAGFVASPTDVANYRRIWSRDGAICGLAAAASGEPELVAALGATLATLTAVPGRHGQVPSNVALDDSGRIGEVSYGGLSGRIDAAPWSAVALAAWRDVGGVPGTALESAVGRGLDLLAAWELNDRGLVYVPQGGDWADAWYHHGYVLYDQLVRLWALECRPGADPEAARRLRRRLAADFLPGEAGGTEPYHPAAAAELLADGPPPHLPASLTPGGYDRRFDALANALAVVLGVAAGDAARRALDHGQAIAAGLPRPLVPAFWPPVEPGEPEWRQLRALGAGDFRNRPGCYHNGGLWPMVNGFWGLALLTAGRRAEARALQEAIQRLNRDGGAWTFPEFARSTDGAPDGTPRTAWSAAAALLLEEALAGRLRLPGIGRIGA